MSIEQEAADLLEQAADGYESGRYYWTHGQYSRMVFGTQAYCSLGALGHEAGLTNGQIYAEDWCDNPILAEAINALGAVIGDNLFPAGNVVTWNDRLQWTEDNRPIPLGKGPVIEAMKHAAKELRNKEEGIV